MTIVPVKLLSWGVAEPYATSASGIGYDGPPGTVRHGCTRRARRADLQRVGVSEHSGQELTEGRSDHREGTGLEHGLGQNRNPAEMHA